MIPQRLLEGSRLTLADERSDALYTDASVDVATLENVGAISEAIERGWLCRAGLRLGRA
jgi:hypothetical protein